MLNKTRKIFLHFFFQNVQLIYYKIKTNDCFYHHHHYHNCDVILKYNNLRKNQCEHSFEKIYKHLSKYVFKLHKLFKLLHKLTI